MTQENSNINNIACCFVFQLCEIIIIIVRYFNRYSMS